MALTGVAVGMKVHIQIVEGYRSKSMELRLVRRRKSSNTDRNPLKPATGSLFPVYISTDPQHINPHELRDLYTTCNHSCHRFPNLIDSNGQVEPVDLRKLNVALSHSAVLVSVFCKTHNIVGDGDDNLTPSINSSSLSFMGLTDLLQRVTPVTPFNGQLVGFGRAISDYGLTASIYDVMVIPSLRRMGIGKMIVKRIVRMLTDRDIYDIAALCSKNERLFFKACGFASDMLGSTTMMYTRTTSTTQEDDQNISRAGRKLLLVPPLRGVRKSPSSIP
ncbi:hypothetical protein L6164_030221 [Bauhinia variegata]|uniref:Uncharacterized protein n=1 Tax=Bauhinia variegata TaxID=167791 RepID=A0ACB9LC40_BAUVA|nr:hypothetical protein L6164_030221 [Bauhinia variegata]